MVRQAVFSGHRLAPHGLQILLFITHGGGAHDFCEDGVEIVRVVVAHQGGNVGRCVVRGGQVGLRQADAPPDYVLDGGVADAALEHVGYVRFAASEGGGHVGNDDLLGVMDVQIPADAVRHFDIVLGTGVDEGVLVQLSGHQEESQRQTLGQSLSSGVSVQALVGALAELLQKLELGA